MKGLTIICGVMLLLTAGPAMATTFDFEDVTGYDFYAYSGSTAMQVADPVHSPTQSGYLSLADTDDYARVAINHSAGTLGDFSGTFWAFIDTDTTNTLIPYMMLGLDADGNGAYDGGTDPLVIAFITGGGTYATDTWVQTGLDQSDSVHVVGDRTGLGATAYSSSNGGGLLSALAQETYSGSTLWGDLQIEQIRVGAGLWPSAGTVLYEAYVDDITVPDAPVPEPATLSLLGLGLSGLAVRRMRKRR